MEDSWKSKLNNLSILLSVRGVLWITYGLTTAVSAAQSTSPTSTSTPQPPPSTIHENVQFEQGDAE